MLYVENGPMAIMPESGSLYVYVYVYVFFEKNKIKIKEY